MECLNGNAQTCAVEENAFLRTHQPFFKVLTSPGSDKISTDHNQGTGEETTPYVF